jgi:uncharacterized protein involved in exopolysaccharide biosynthesis
MQRLPGNSFAVQESSSLRPFVEAAFRYRRLWLFAVASVILLTLLYVVLTPRQYQSEMEILVQNTRGEDQITPQRTTGVVTVNEVTEEQLNSEVELLRSPGLANLVVDPQWDNQPATTRPADQLKAHDKAVERFEKHLSIDLLRKSDVIQVVYSASDPYNATQALNRLLNAFMAKQREIAQPPGTTEFFAAAAARYKKDLDQAQQELAAYQQQHQVVSLPDTEQAIDREINDAQTDLRSTDAQISEASQRINSQVGQLKSIPSRQATVERTLPNDYSVERLNTMLAELQNKRTTLLTKFTPDDRLVKETDQQIADTKAALGNARQMTSEEHSTDINPVWQTVTGSIILDQTERQALKAKHSALEQQIDSLRGTLTSAEGSTVAFTTLRQKVTDLENNYQLYTQKRDEAQIADAMNENKLLNIAVAQSPTFAVTPFCPMPVTDMAFGTFTAVFLASFIVFCAEMSRTTIATPRDLERLLRFPPLATVPLALNRRGDARDSLPEVEPLSIILPPARGPASTERVRPAFVAHRKETQAS